MSIPDFERAEYIETGTAPPPPPVEYSAPIPDAAAFPRAILYGAGGALLGSLIYALVGLWIEIGFVSILVGILVGNGMMNGSGGVGGRRYQVVAVILTYFAVTFAYVLDALWYEIRKSADGSAHLANNLVIIVVLLIAGPFLKVAASVGHGLIGLLILFFGMQSAWRVTAGGQNYLHFRRPDPASPLGLR
jgi:hypothetical protein